MISSLHIKNVALYDAVGNEVVPMLTHYLIDGLRHLFAEPRFLPVDGILLPITNSCFNTDSYLLEGSQVMSVALLDKQKRKVMMVGCDQTQAYELWATGALVRDYGYRWIQGGDWEEGVGSSVGGGGKVWV